MILSIWPAADQVIFVLRNSYFGPFSWSLKIENLTNFISINWQYYLSTSDWSRRTLNRLLHIEWWIEMMWTRLVRRGNRLNNIIIAIVNVFPIEANRKVQQLAIIGIFFIAILRNLHNFYGAFFYTRTKYQFRLARSLYYFGTLCSTIVWQVGISIKVSVDHSEFPLK